MIESNKTTNISVTMPERGVGALLGGRYRVVRQLGQGGMGSVWLAEDVQLDNKQFAIKMLPSILVSNKRAYRQLKDEALVAMKLTHPNIVTLRAFEENDGNPFLVMDYVDGVTLDEYLADYSSRVEHVERVEGEAGGVRSPGGISEDEVVRILKPIAAALDYAHKKGVVHRDVKPGNVMIAKDGTPYILDFGIAREIQETMTRVTGKLSSGTLLYMSPEQLRGAKPQPGQDVYSFAAMAYECLRGEPPFSRGQIEYQILNEQPETLRSDGVLAIGIMAGLAKKPEDRPATCAAMLEGKNVHAERVDDIGGTRHPAEPRGTRSVAAVKGLIAVSLLAALAGGAWWWLAGRSGAKGTAGTNDVTSVVENGSVAKPASPPQIGPTESDVAEIAVEATVQKARVERIDDADGFKERKIVLSDSLTRATANRDERRWAEAARGFTNYVDGCKALVALDAERKTAVSADKKASAARKRAQDASAEKYAASRWNEAEKQMASATAAFGVMRFAEADKAFCLAQKQFNTSAGEANDERKRQEEQRKKNAEAARSRASEASKEADAAGAKEYAPDKWKAATESWDRGMKAWDTGDLATAITAYEEARRYYDACVQAAKSQAEKVKKAYDLFEKGQYKELMEIKGEDANLPDVAFLQGIVYEDGLLSVPDWKKACERYEVAVKRDHPLACAALGALHSGKCAFLYGMEKQDKERGLSLISKAKAKLHVMAEANNIYAQDLLGYLYWEGLGYEANRDVATEWYMKVKDRLLTGADQGILDAQLRAGCRWRAGQWGKTNYVEAVRWLRKAADQGLAVAQNLMGLAYNNGKGVEKDYDEAMKWYRKAADQGLAIAQYNIGTMYWDGRGVRQDRYEAVRWLHKAADQGLAIAQNLMGRAYDEGRGVEKDYDEAMKWYRKAADQGLAIAQHNIGVMYWNGSGVRQDYYEAVRWLRKAADQGRALAQVHMGRAYDEGWGVEKDYDEAMKWYRKAADQGLALAQYNIGAMYWDGRGVRQDYYEAVRWLRKAANQGEAMAQNAMGRAYNEGWGVEKDYDEAMKWYRKAADQGLAIAQNNIGIMYWEGNGVQQNRYEAVRWLRKAAAQGNEDAKKTLKSLGYD